MTFMRARGMYVPLHHPEKAWHVLRTQRTFVEMNA